MKINLSRNTITLSPVDLGRAFAKASAGEQIEFLNAAAASAAKWPGGFLDVPNKQFEAIDGGAESSELTITARAFLKALSAAVNPPTVPVDPYKVFEDAFSAGKTVEWFSPVSDKWEKVDGEKFTVRGSAPEHLRIVESLNHPPIPEGYKLMPDGTKPASSPRHIATYNGKDFDVTDVKAEQGYYLLDPDVSVEKDDRYFQLDEFHSSGLGKWITAFGMRRLVLETASRLVARKLPTPAPVTPAPSSPASSAQDPEPGYYLLAGSEELQLGDRYWSCSRERWTSAREENYVGCTVASTLSGKAARKLPTGVPPLPSGYELLPDGVGILTGDLMFFTKDSIYSGWFTCGWGGKDYPSGHPCGYGMRYGARKIQK